MFTNIDSNKYIWSTQKTSRLNVIEEFEMYSEQEQIKPWYTIE